MDINFSQDLKEVVKKYGKDLQVQAKYLSEKEMEEGYLKGAYGNAYDFDQKDKLDAKF